MTYSFLYLILAAFGLGILIFIHELGHYWMARREGMTVEVFSIGFGKPLLVWTFQGVKWQLCALPFGGYVRIAGMEKQGSLEPHQIPNGFYGKKPLARIKVAIMGPLVNMVFAILAFSVLWLSGGRPKSFSEYTHLIGFVDSSSSLYDSGVRPGDELTQINHKPFNGFNDFLYAAVLDPENLQIEGLKVNYFNQDRQPFSYTFENDLKSLERATAAMGVISPANYLIFANSTQGGLAEETPMKDSGVEYGDRLLWMDGELIFSRRQLVSIVNESKSLLKVQRGGNSFLTRIPRLKISDLRLSSAQKAELDDWQHEAGLKTKVGDLYFIPYNLTDKCVVEEPVIYLNQDSREQVFASSERAPLAIPLEKGDRILSVDGQMVTQSSSILTQLQSRRIQIIVKKEGSTAPVSWKKADAVFAAGLDIDQLKEIIATVGTANPISQVGDLKLLKPVTPKPFNDFNHPDAERNQRAKEFEAQKKMIEKIENSQEREAAFNALEENQKKLALGIVFRDSSVQYNPSPFTQFGNVCDEIRKTFGALFTGYLSPKWLAGPVGIVQVMQKNWSEGFKEALFWMGVISLNLGLLNLLPVPVLDGGHICFSLWEAITKKPIPSKVMERMIIPFVVLLVIFFIYVTYHDIMRLVQRFL